MERIGAKKRAAIKRLEDKKSEMIHTSGAEFSKVIFSATKSSPSTIVLPHPKVPVPITRDA